MAVTSRVDARYFIRPPVGDALNVALVAGPMYDPLYELLPEFEAKAGRRVHVAARLLDMAAAGEILVSRTVRDLAFGGEQAFVLRGRRHLAGLAGRWDVYTVGAGSDVSPL